jgi:purine-binding chemotaxis protein CheW
MAVTGGGKPAKTGSAAVESASEEFVTFDIAGQFFGIHVPRVQDVLSETKTTPVPLAPVEIEGSLNLRGRIVTAMSIRRRLGLAPREEAGAGMSIVVEHEGDLYSLMVDSVGEVLALSDAEFERNPPTLDPTVREYPEGIYRLEGRLLVLLDVSRLLDFSRSVAA